MRLPLANEIVWGGGVLAFALLCAGFFATCTRPAQAGIATEDPCDASERRWGKRARGCPGETAGDRWSADQRSAKHVPREEAEAILDQVELPKDPIKLAEITPNGNLVVTGRAELLVIFCDDEKIAYVADLAGGFSFARGANDGDDPDEIASAVGVRCSATLLANKDRPVGITFRGCRTILCFADDALYRAYNPTED